MTELSPKNKEVLARMAAFSYSGFKTKVYGNITTYCKSFVGRDFKAWAQMALFIITPYLSEEETTVWLNLTKVHAHLQYTYTCIYIVHYVHVYIAGVPDLLLQVLLSSEESRVGSNMPNLCQFHTLGISHLYEQAEDSSDTAPSGVYGRVWTDCCIQYRKVSSILASVQCTITVRFIVLSLLHRCESFNSFIRNQNINGNRHAPSRDIAQSFAVMEYIRFICSSER